MKALLFIVLGISLASAETENYIHATCRITGIRNVAQATTGTWTDKCVLETPPLPDGFNNYYRVRVRLSGAAPIVTNVGDISDLIKAQNSEIGDITFTSLLWGSIVVSPESAAIRASIAGRAADLEHPAIEIRPQTIRISQPNDCTLEILFLEPQGDFDGKTPSIAWTARYIESFRRLSHSR
jgi:hypothetical protein